MSIRKIIAIVCVPILLLCSCKTRYVTTEVPVAVEHTTESVRVDIVRDTLIQRDSVITLIMGDTTIIERWHHVADVSRMIHTDTVVEYREKPVTVTKTEVREVNVLHWWQKCLMWAGALLMAAIAVMGVVMARRIGKN